MRVNVYAEELTDRIEIVSKKAADGNFTGLRFHMRTREDGHAVDSGAVTFWSTTDIRGLLRKALHTLDDHYAHSSREKGSQAKASSR